MVIAISNSSRAQNRFRLRHRLFQIVAFMVSIISMTGCAPSIHDLTAKGDTDRIASMLAGNPELLEQTNTLGQTPIHYAATNNRLDSLEVLVNSGANLNAQDGTGLTALHNAAQGDFRHVLRFLIKNGADYTLADTFGDEPLHRAAIFGSSDAVNDLLKVGASARTPNAEGNTPLDLARRFGHAGVVNRLKLVVGEE